MKKIEVYECSYCGKRIFKNKNACTAHEKKCFHNPETRSCATCLYSRFADFSVPKGQLIGLHTCLLNEDITIKKRTQCSNYSLKGEDPNVVEIYSKLWRYEPIPVVENYLKTKGITYERPVLDLCEIDPIFLLKGNYYINELGKYIYL